MNKQSGKSHGGKDKDTLTPEDLRGVLMEKVSEAGSQKSLAEKIEISQAYLSDVLSARRQPGDKILKALGYRRATVYTRLPTAS